MEDINYEDEIYGNFGVVKFVSGKYKGRFAYYDNDDFDEDSGCDKAVVYLGSMMHNFGYILVDYKDITCNYTVQELFNRVGEICKLFWQDIGDSERILLLEEKSLIENEIINQYQDYVVSRDQKMPKVFMSHSSFDKRTVANIALDLKQRGISSWIDSFDILPGESIISKIEEGLEQCDLILLFLSKRAVESNWVKTELQSVLWDEINTNETKLIPIKLEDCEIPKLLKPKKYIDFSKDYNAGLRELLTTIKKYSEKKETAK